MSCSRCNSACLGHDCGNAGDEHLCRSCLRRARYEKDSIGSVVLTTDLTFASPCGHGTFTKNVGARAYVLKDHSERSADAEALALEPRGFWLVFEDDGARTYYNRSPLEEACHGDGWFFRRG